VIGPPPILAVGAYFSAWHALRHVARLLAVDDDAVAALDRGSTAGALRSFAVDAAPLTAVSLVIVAALAVVVPATPTGLPGLVGLYLVAIAVLTLPHFAIVTAMDREQGVW